MQDYRPYLTWISTLHKEMALILEARIGDFSIKRLTVNGHAPAALSQASGAVILKYEVVCLPFLQDRGMIYFLFSIFKTLVSLSKSISYVHKKL